MAAIFPFVFVIGSGVSKQSEANLNVNELHIGDGCTQLTENESKQETDSVQRQYLMNNVTHVLLSL